MGLLMFSKTLKQPIEFHFKTTSSDIISNLTNENSGKVYAWDGEEIGP